MTTKIQVSALQASLTLACDIYTLCNLPAEQNAAAAVSFTSFLTGQAEKNWHDNVRCDSPSLSNFETHVTEVEFARHGFADQGGNAQLAMLLNAFHQTFQKHLTPEQKEQAFGPGFTRLFVQSEQSAIYSQNTDVDFKVKSWDPHYALEHLPDWKQRNLLHTIKKEIRFLLTGDTFTHAIARQALVQDDLKAFCQQRGKLLTDFWECSKNKGISENIIPVVKEWPELNPEQLKPVFRPTTN